MTLRQQELEDGKIVERKVVTCRTYSMGGKSDIEIEISDTEVILRMDDEVINMDHNMWHAILRDKDFFE